MGILSYTSLEVKFNGYMSNKSSELHYKKRQKLLKVENKKKLKDEIDN